jgi:hypothetical protein
MLEPCGRGPSYSGRLIARAVELYLSGVKPGYIRWDELQATLEKEFASEIREVGQDKPAPETVIGWARKYPDAPERLRALRVQQVAPNQRVLRAPVYPSAGELRPALSTLNTGAVGWDINALFIQFMAMAATAILARFIVSLSAER